MNYTEEQISYCEKIIKKDNCEKCAGGFLVKDRSKVCPIYKECRETAHSIRSEIVKLAKNIIKEKILKEIEKL